MVNKVGVYFVLIDEDRSPLPISLLARTEQNYHNGPHTPGVMGQDPNLGQKFRDSLFFIIKWRINSQSLEKQENWKKLK